MPEGEPMSIPILALILQGIPESIALAILGYLFTNTNLNWFRITILGLMCAFTAYFLRLFPAGFGFHILAIIFVIFMFLTYVEKISVIPALTAAFFSEVLLIVIESACLAVISFLCGQDISSYICHLANNVYQRIAVAWVHTLILFVLAYVIFYFKRRRKPTILTSGRRNG